MRSCLIIIPYFGRLPNYFQLFLDSCSYNDKFDFLVLTNDASEYSYPKNVKVEYCQFQYMRDKVKSIHKDATLEQPQKLCDYRPSYGFLFQEYLQDYRYWGHCDIDLIFGNLNKLVFPIIKANTYDKVFNLGHLTLYKNIDYVNNLFFNEINDRKNESIFFTDNLCKFDEENGNSIVKYALKEKLSIYTTQLEADIATKSSKLLIDKYNFLTNSHRVIRNNILFVFSKGNVFGYMLHNGNLVKEEYSYIHLQKRNMKLGINTQDNEYVIAANRFYSLRERNQDLSNIDKTDFNKIKRYFLNLHYLRLRSKNLFIKIRNIKKRFS